MKWRMALWLVLVQAGFLVLVGAQAAGQEHWVATWTTAQLMARSAQPQRAPAGPPGAASQSIAARGFSNQTVRMIARTSIGGRRLRVKLANAFGSAPVAVGAAHIALRGKGPE